MTTLNILRNAYFRCCNRNLSRTKMDVKQKLKDWKIQTELLKMQMLLGKKETEIAFEGKKKEMSQ
ncbi:MAG: hypothetical protein QMC40_03860 [Vicingaceae bacterium]|jgi:hypothetical protein